MRRSIAVGFLADVLIVFCMAFFVPGCAKDSVGAKIEADLVDPAQGIADLNKLTHDKVQAGIVAELTLLAKVPMAGKAAAQKEAVFLQTQLPKAIAYIQTTGSKQIGAVNATLEAMVLTAATPAVGTVLKDAAGLLGMVGLDPAQLVTNTMISEAIAVCQGAIDGANQWAAANAPAPPKASPQKANAAVPGAATGRSGHNPADDASQRIPSPTAQGVTNGEYYPDHSYWGLASYTQGQVRTGIQYALHR